SLMASPPPFTQDDQSRLRSYPPGGALDKDDAGWGESTPGTRRWQPAALLLLAREDDDGVGLTAEVRLDEDFAAADVAGADEDQIQLALFDLVEVAQPALARRGLQLDEALARLVHDQCHLTRPAASPRGQGGLAFREGVDGLVV